MICTDVVCNSAFKPVQPLGRRLIRSKFGHALPVDLDEVEVAAREQCQIRPGERCVIERDPRAGAGNTVERIQAQLVGDAALGNFDDELLDTRG